MTTRLTTLSTYVKFFLIIAGSIGVQALTHAAPLLLSPPALLAPVDLRGYGRVAGTYRTVPSMPGASALVVSCATVEKAKLLAAKYVSDLESLPGVSTAAVPGRPGLTAHAVAGLGVIVAVRAGADVDLLTARDPAGVRALVNALHLTAGRLVSNPEVRVPMYLDRWDKFGFRFYYRPWEQPPGWPNDTLYDVRQEFEFARKNGRSGFVFWDEMNMLDAADGVSNEVWWDYAERAASKYNLPIAINDTVFGRLNSDRSQEAQRMPQYVGDLFGPARQDIGGLGTLSWNATTAAERALGSAQSTIHDFMHDPNVVSWLEPHGELSHGEQTVFMEWGPAADDGYRRYMRESYGTLAAIGLRWYGDAAHFKSWEELKVPELASFAGWGADAIDLTGAWRIGYEPFVGTMPPAYALNNYGNRKVDGTTPAPDAWYAGHFDDSAWPTLVAPGNDAAMFLAKRPAVYRRTFDVPPEWRSAHPKAWLYVWDLTMAAEDTIRTFLNGTELPASPTVHAALHWMALDVSNTLHSGPNSLAIRLPKGYLAYRVYVSASPPDQYPDLGAQADARWVDFASWQQWCRVNMVERGVQMIRQVDPDRQITQMDPDDYADAIKGLSEAYGTEFHNTGYMSGFYADLDPLLMSGSDLPTSVEPGGPASSLLDYKKQMGLWYSEGVQGVDYFIHIGDILWRSDIRQYFENTQNQVHLFGKYHAPKAKVGVLFSYKTKTIDAFPWTRDANMNLQSGYWAWNPAAYIRDRADRDGITDRDFARGGAAAYRVIFDTNSSIMDEQTLGDIEKYVRDGGVFVTLAQTGRHSPLASNAWPVSRLTGYEVTHIDRLTPAGDPAETRTLQLAPGQTLYDEAALASLNAVPANGLSLRPAAADVHDLLLWDDGTVAAGYRRLGKGMIIDLGCKWRGSHMFDRVDPGGHDPQARAITTLLTKILDWLDIPPVPAHLNSASDEVLMRHWLSNNGLYDVWTLWNRNPAAARTVDLMLNGQPETGYEVDSGKRVPLQTSGVGKSISGIMLEPMQTRIFLTTRPAIETAPLDWLTLQRHWWRGTAKAPATPLPGRNLKLTLDLGEDWTWRAAAANEDVAAIARAPAGIGKGESRRLGVWSLSNHEDVKHGIFQKAFSVPATWTSGRVELWLQSWSGATFMDGGRVWVDGDLVKDWNRDGIAGNDLGGRFKPGSTHWMTVEASGAGSLVGSRGTAWLAWKPAASRSLDLGGDWVASRDMLRYGPAIQLPGDYHAQSLKRTVVVPASFAGSNIVFSTTAPNPMMGVLVNGRWVRRHEHMIGDRWSLNVTPWIKPGIENTLEMVAPSGPGWGRVSAIALEAYPVGVYP